MKMERPLAGLPRAGQGTFFYRMREARTRQDFGVIQRRGVGCEPGQLAAFGVGILGNFIGVEGPGQHDAELGLGDGVRRLEAPVCVAAHDALSGRPSDSVAKRVARGHVGEAGHQGHIRHTCNVRSGPAVPGR